MLRLELACAWLVAASTCIGCGSASTPSPEPPRLEQASQPAATPQVLRGERLLVHGQVAEAKRAFETAIAGDPSDARAWLDLGLVHEAEKDFDAAEVAYRRATELDPRFAEALNNLGVLLRERSRLEEATSLLERAVALEPELVAARFNLALTYEDRGLFANAEREYLATIAARPGDPVPRINLAMMYLDAGRDDDALPQLRAAAPGVRNDVLLSIAVGEGLRRAGAPMDAVGVLRAALEDAGDPPPTELLAELGLAHYAAGDLDAAERDMRRAIEQDELDPALQYAYGAILAKQGQVGRARAHLRRAIRLDPDGPYAERAQRRLDALK